MANAPPQAPSDTVTSPHPRYARNAATHKPQEHTAMDAVANHAAGTVIAVSTAYGT